MSTIRFLTGITPSGTPHLGNYAGSIRPAVAASRRSDVQSFYFLADYHALIKCEDPQRIQRSTLEIAASWLAAGLDPQQVIFYRQSDVPQIAELHWLLSCVTGKGVLNRAHAYKAAQDKNQEAGRDSDEGVTAGLFMYPVLMGADILMFKAHKVPVGRDQIQHIEMARDMAASFNHLYGEHFVLPEAAVEEHVATLPGLDGRKMSKSYDNTIPVFAPRAQLHKLIQSIVTDSRAPGQPKQVEGSALFQMYQAFASAQETAALRQAYVEGIAWGQAKEMVFECIDHELAPLRQRYEDLMAHPEHVQAILHAGAERARALAIPFMHEVREAVGLRPVTYGATPSSAAATAGKSGKAGKATKATKAQLPSFKQYRESDGQFYFKLIDASGRLLVQSNGFATPKEVGHAIVQLQQHGPQVLAQHMMAVADVTPQEISAALQALAQAAAASAPRI